MPIRTDIIANAIQTFMVAIVKSIIATVDDDKLCWQVSLPTRKVAGTQDEFDVDYMVATTPPLKVEPALLHTHTQACTHARSQRAHACA